jgi:hypothetical protein
MDTLKTLAAAAGSWRGNNVLQDPQFRTRDESVSEATVQPILGGRFVRMDYTWQYQGKPQEGSLLVGADRKTGVVTAYWIDTWHMSDAVMVCTGSISDGAGLSLRGSYAVPGHPDWGWRIELTPSSGDTLRMVMFNIWPEGTREELAMETLYSRP